MESFENAVKFFRNCEGAKGWEACKEYVADNATFNAQSEPMAELTQVKEYVDAMAGLGTVTLAGSSFQIHTSSFDKENNTAMIFATFTGTHVGEGGPISPTNKTTNSHYVFVIKMNSEGKVEHITKIWNSSWAFRELGWMD